MSEIIAAIVVYLIFAGILVASFIVATGGL